MRIKKHGKSFNTRTAATLVALASGLLAAAVLVLLRRRESDEEWTEMPDPSHGLTAAERLQW